mmetsp:Transcript_13019/g.14424  ORF Transcript_13019/g.14424 Transcript_13019/m.14424 type:complete len:441 (+) Transcript_13019:35-1357(+)
MLTMLVSVSSILNSYEEVLGAFDHFNTKESIRSYIRENEELFQIDDAHHFMEKKRILDKIGAANKDHLLYYYTMEEIVAKERESKRQRGERLKRYHSGQGGQNRGGQSENKEAPKEKLITQPGETQKPDDVDETEDDSYANGKEMLQNNKALAKANLSAVLIPWLPLSKPKNLLIWNSMRQAIHDVWQERLNRAPIAFIGVPLLLHIFIGAFVVLSELFQVLSSGHYFIVQSIWAVVIISVIAYSILSHGTNVNETEDGFFSKMIDLELSLTADLEVLFKSPKTNQQRGFGRAQSGRGQGGGRGQQGGGKGQQGGKGQGRQNQGNAPGDDTAKSQEDSEKDPQTKPVEPPKVVKTPEQQQRQSFRQQRKLNAEQDEERLEIERQNLNAKLSLIGIIRSHISGNRDPVKILGFEASAEFLSTVVGFYITLGTALFSMTLLE